MLRNLLMTLGTMLAASVLQAQQLTWTVVPLPGAFNVRDAQLVDGLLFEAMQLIDAQLPEWQTRYEVLSLARLEQRMGERGESCSSGQLKSAERDRQGYFVPYLLSTPMHVLVRRQTLEQLLIEDGQVSLAWLFANPYLRGALAKARAYPPDIRQALQRALAEGRLQELGGSVAGDNLLLMVSHRRLDYVFDYPLIYTEVARTYSLSEPLVSVPLRESAQLVPVGIYCPRSEWGMRMARRIDQAVRKAAQQPQDFMALHERWLPAEVYQRYHAQLQGYYRERARMSAAPAP